MPIPSPPDPNTGYPYGETVTRLRAVAVVDPYSGEATGEDWTTPDTLDIPGCAFDPGGSSEPLDVGRASVVTQPTLYHPSTDLDVTAQDRIEVRGRTWQVDGDPAVYRNPYTGWEAGTAIRLKAVEG